MKMSISAAVWLAAVSLSAVGLTAAPVLAAEGKGAPKENTTFVSVDTLTAAINAPNGRREVVTVQSGIDVPDLALRNRAFLLTPRLRDAYSEELRTYAASLIPGKPPDADYLAKRMQGVTDRVLGKPGGHYLLGGIMIN